MERFSDLEFFSCFKLDIEQQLISGTADQLLTEVYPDFRRTDSYVLRKNLVEVLSPIKGILV